MSDTIATSPPAVPAIPIPTHQTHELIPMHDRCLVVQEKPEEKTKGGVILPFQAQSKPVYGEVVRVGEGTYQNGILIPMKVKEGDLVLYGQYSGTSVKFDDVDYLCLKETEILTVVREKHNNSTRP